MEVTPMSKQDQQQTPVKAAVLHEDKQLQEL